jgi:hypothetical protein
MTHPLNAISLPEGLRLGLEDLAGDLAYARRNSDLARLALLCYCEIRRWARLAGEEHLADLSGALVSEHPARDREAFLEQVDGVVIELEHVCERAGIHGALK